MAFFKNFKDDFSQAVNELLPNELSEKEEKVANTDSDNIVGQEKNVEGEADLKMLNAILAEEDSHEEENIEEKDTLINPETLSEEPSFSNSNGNNEITVIARGTLVNGNISAEGSVEVIGAINGDVDCLGKLSVSGKMNGNCSAHDVYITSERLIGCINSETNVQVGQGAIIIGDINATSGIISGAIKGNIDINGPIIIDSTAVVKGNITAKSIQINKGAIIEGFCSMAYAAVNIDSIFA